MREARRSRPNAAVPSPLPRKSEKANNATAVPRPLGNRPETRDRLRIVLSEEGDAHVRFYRPLGADVDRASYTVVIGGAAAATAALRCPRPSG